MRRTRQICLVVISLGLILFSTNCANNPVPLINKTAELDEPVAPTASSEKPSAPRVVDVPALADKPAAEFDKIFGPPQKITKITDNPAMMPGEYRLYNVAGHPKGLSVRFYKDAAKRFNLLLGESAGSSQMALLDVFKIDVKRAAPDTSEPLSEKWSGNFGGVRFATAYAKKEKAGGDFTMLHAEVAR